ncbi:MAG: hypothetical protein RR313_11095 [Anaerovoracaceae bacterium]
MASYNEKTKALIESLGKLTDSEKIQWMRLSKYVSNYQNQELRSFLIENNRYIYSSGNASILEESKSLCAMIDTGIVYLLMYKPRKGKEHPESIICALQESAAGKIITITNKETFQDESKNLKEKIDKILNENRLNIFWDRVIALANEN